MTKATLTALVNYLNGATIDNLDEIREELTAELNRNAVKAQANRELYALAHDAAMAGLKLANRPVTSSELYDEIAGDLPEGFTAGKLRYAMSRLWNDELERHSEGKGAATYTVR